MASELEALKEALHWLWTRRGNEPLLLPELMEAVGSAIAQRAQETREEVMPTEPETTDRSNRAPVASAAAVPEMAAAEVGFLDILRDEAGDIVYSKRRWESVDEMLRALCRSSADLISRQAAQIERLEQENAHHKQDRGSLEAHCDQLEAARDRLRAERDGLLKRWQWLRALVAEREKGEQFVPYWLVLEWLDTEYGAATAPHPAPTPGGSAARQSSAAAPDAERSPRT